VQGKRVHRSIGWTSDLTPINIHRRTTLRIDQRSDALADLFRLAKCPVCSSFSRLGSNQAENITCKTCSSEMAVESARDCYIPMGFVIDFIDRTDEEEDDHLTRASRTSTAEASLITLERVAGTNLKKTLDRRLLVYRLNRGEWRDDNWSGFDANRGALESTCKD
jgi:hypothetical protein